MGEEMVALVRDAAASGSTIAISGSRSKAMFGQPAGDAELSTRSLSGVVDYRPDELVITAWAGTPLSELDEVLAQKGQLMPFEPPRFRGGGTLGGAIAAALGGPARPWRGAVRDAVLGVEIVNGLGERLSFGGSVMKNVAGYDVSRLMTGAFGTLGLILSASVRLLPVPDVEETVAQEMSAEDAAVLMKRILREPVPVTATCFVEGELSLRLSGTRLAVDDAKRQLGLNRAADATIWPALRDHAHPFFASAKLHRFSVPRGEHFAPPGCLVEWGGAQVWQMTPDTGASFTGAPFGAVVDRDPALIKYERRLKSAFDPHGVLNPGFRGIGS